MGNIKPFREELYQLVWSSPMSEIAESYKVTDGYLRKLCLKYSIPTPGAGHWMKLKFGKVSEKIELPEFDKEFEFDDLKQFLANEGPAINSETSLEARMKEIQNEPSILGNVPERLTKPDELIKEVEEEIQRRLKRYVPYNGMIQPFGSFLDIKVTKNQLNRALRIFDTFIKNLRTRSHEIKVGNNETKLIMYGEEMQIQLRELTKKEIINDGYERTEYMPTGKLVIRLKGYYTYEWKDGKIPLEDQMLRMLAKLELLALKKKAEFDIYRKQWAQRKIEGEEQERDKEKAEEEKKMFNALLAEAERYMNAKKVNDYLNEVERLLNQGIVLPGKSEEWLKWARNKLSLYDPLAIKH